MDPVGIEPTTWTLQVSIAPLEHVSPIFAGVFIGFPLQPNEMHKILLVFQLPQHGGEI